MASLDCALFDELLPGHEYQNINRAIKTQKHPFGTKYLNPIYYMHSVRTVDSTSPHKEL